MTPQLFFTWFLTIYCAVVLVGVAAGVGYLFYKDTNEKAL
jgi:hypothetical protein